MVLIRGYKMPAVQRMISVISASAASEMMLGYYVNSDAVVVDSKWGDDKEGSLSEGFRQWPFDLDESFGL